MGAHAWRCTGHHHALSQDPCRGFGYGSGVFKQPGLYDAAPDAAGGTSGSSGGASGSGGSVSGTLRSTAPTAAADKPMLDFIFVVDDPVAWHAEVGAGLQELGRRGAGGRGSCLQNVWLGMRRQGEAFLCGLRAFMRAGEVQGTGAAR